MRDWEWRTVGDRGKERKTEINYEILMRKRMGNIKKERETEGEREKGKNLRVTEKGREKEWYFWKKNEKYK